MLSGIDPIAILVLMQGWWSDVGKCCSGCVRYCVGLDGTLCVCDVIYWVAFVDVNVTQGYGLWWGNEFGVFYLVLMEVCAQYVCKMLVLFSVVVLREE